MCHYCGCRETPLLRDYIAEHERVINHGGAAIRALDRGDGDVARAELTAMAGELATHWRGEENGLFAVMGTDPMFAAHIGPLVAEHRELAALLASVDLDVDTDRERFTTAFADLYGHIAKEEDGLFPAWHQAHPGTPMIGETS